MPTIFPRATDSFQAITYPPGPTALSTVTLISGGTNNTKGSYSELAAATAFAANRVYVHVAGANTAGRRYLVDLAIGEAGKEVVILSNLLFEGAANAGAQAASVTISLPLEIPAGVRLAARSQCSTATSTLWFVVTLVKDGQRPGIGSWVTYGANTGTSGGAGIDPGGVADTKGAYTEIAASTSADLHTLVLQTTNRGNLAPALNNWSVDIAIGSLGNEVVIVPDLRLASTVTSLCQPGQYTIPIFLPSGTRIAVRASSASIDATDRLIDVVILGGTALSESPDGLSWAPISILAGAGLSLIRAVASGAGVRGS